LSPTYYNILYLPLLRVKELLKWHAFISGIRPSINTHPDFSGRNANQNFHGIIPPNKIIKLRAIKGDEKSAWSRSH
jgi:hypothetical protein